MSKENKIISYDEIVQELSALCSDKSTGTMFIVSDSGHSSRISMLDGEIRCFAYSMHKGNDALLDMYNMKTGKYHFSAGIYNPYNKLELPETSELLIHFKNKSFPPDMSQEKKVDLSQTMKITDDMLKVSSAETSNKGHSKVKMSMEASKIIKIVDDIEVALTNYLGPFADITVQDYLNSHKRPDSRTDFKQMIDFLVFEIDEVKEQESFKVDCDKILINNK